MACTLVAVFVACRTAAHAGEAARIGVMTHFAQGWDPALAPVIGAADVHDARDELYWDVVEATPGKYVFPASYETYMAALKAHDISPLVVLSFGNHNYDGGLTPYTDEGIAAYARYAVEVLRHYGSQIKAVEIWNEYNGSFCKGPAAADRTGNYLRLLKAAYAAIKAERPDVTVVGCATAGLPMPYLERIFAGGGLEFMDAVSIHPYRTASTPEGLEDQMVKLQEMIARYSPFRAKPVWVTEIGWGTRVSQAEGDLAIDENTQAKFLSRAFALLVSAGVEHAYWYLFRDYAQFPTMGVVRANAEPKPAYRALAALEPRLSASVFAGRAATPADLYALRFVRGDGTAWHLLWSLTARTVAIPPGVAIHDLDGNDVPATTSLTVGDSPFYIDGELPGLPPPETNPAAVVADSLTGFSAQQGRNGWSYGARVGDTGAFKPLGKFQITDWKEEWTDVYPYISVTGSEQHPSVTGGTPVWVVRRWTAASAGAVTVEGSFKCGVKGDGVRVRVSAGDHTLFSQELGSGKAVLARFELETTLAAGEALDFAVDPGPAGSSDFDSTEFSVVVRQKIIP